MGLVSDTTVTIIVHAGPLVMLLHVLHAGRQRATLPDIEESLTSSVKRCRIVKDRIRLWKEGVRDLVMELCCALHNFRVRLHPWLPMI